MIKTLRESKAKLSELVELASRGEDVLITVMWPKQTLLTSTSLPQKTGPSSRLILPEKKCFAPCTAKSWKVTSDRGRPPCSSGNFSAMKARGTLSSFLTAGRDVVAEAERLVERCYAVTPPLIVRSPDVIHVASALAGKAKTLVATDSRLREAVRMMSLNVLP